MININDKVFYLNLLDTNAISEIIKNKNGERESYFSKILINRTVPCISLWSIIELRKSEYLYPKFLQLFSIFPISILKPFPHILKEEVKNNSSKKIIDPILFTFNPHGKKEEKLEGFFKDFFKDKNVLGLEKKWSTKWTQEVLDAILLLKDNFQSKNKNFNSNDAKKFLKIGIPQYLKSQYPEKFNNIENQSIKIENYPSVKTLFYTVFYRFYLEKRKPELADIPDLMINFIAPYIDSIIVEKFQAEIFRKVKLKDNFLKDFKVYTLKDIK
jgi:hypothetical protein